ncbi:hypothetical protein NECHADRAFT_77368 [Paecilomyces variotii No. 5]|uniref:Cupin type-2 domain-containing protein n=1 Tax=Byssochlamys spectabilis (strain No. 5 / NBRC 109023) TaxID=1356009 RepID=V5G7Z1_BYSSN|nr:hypothetical protein NECHADRAFT_77368 [Paecilomyces variotii No. 5]
MSKVVHPSQPPVENMIPRAQKFLQRHCNISNDLKAIPTDWRWGFVVYRTVYTPESYTIWPTAIAKLEAYLFREIDCDLLWQPPSSWIWRGPINSAANAAVKSHMQNLHLNDQKQCNGLDINAVRERFIELTQSRARKNGSDVNNGLKWEFCLIIDKDVLQSLVDAPEPVAQSCMNNKIAGHRIRNPGYIKVIDRSFNTGENPTCRDRNDYTGWMKASLNCLWILYDLAEMELECPYRNKESGEFPVWDGGLPRREPYPQLGRFRPSHNEDDDDDNNDRSPFQGMQRGTTEQGTRRRPAASAMSGTQRGPPGGVQRPRPQLGPGNHPYNPNIRRRPLTPELIAAGQAAAIKLRERENEKKREMEEAEENVLASINNEYEIKVAKLSGEFVWHSHPTTDEVFYILSGNLTIRLNEPGRERGLEDVDLSEGDIFVVPKGVRHCPVTKDGEETVVLLMEPSGVVNTGDSAPVEGRTNAVEDIR